jgi:hypothetical protein
LVFVNRHLLRQESGQTLYDPFALNVSQDEMESVYVERDQAEEQVRQPGNRIILGRKGTGKTTLSRRLSASLPKQALVVQLPLSRMGTLAPEDKLMEGKVSLLTADLLVQYIFNAYWESLFRDHAKRARYIPSLRQNPWWMVTLHWFYEHSPPLHPEIPEEFELMSWLNSPSSAQTFRPHAPEDRLRELIRLITFRQERYGAPPAQPYVQIHVLIDGTERPSNLAINRLLCDTQHLHDLYLTQVQFKLFADLTWQKQIQDLDCVRQGYVTLYRLPQWGAGDLARMLYLRLKSRTQGEFVSFDSERDWGTLAEYNWGKMMPSNVLEPGIKSEFVQAIVNGATRVYQKKESDLDAPIHVLRLARSLLAACAGCWAEFGYQPPLTAEQIGELVDLYWNIE